MRKRTWLAAVAIVLAGAGWMVARGPQSEPSAAAASPAPETPPLAAGDTRAAPVAVAPASAAAPPASAPAPAKPPPGPYPHEPAAELLRKAQLGLGGGSAKEAQEAANVLQFCAHAARNAEGLQSARDTLSLMPKFILKFIDSFGGISDEQIAQAQADARRCQVFDEATLARRGEMFQKAHEGGAPNSAMPYLTWLVTDGKSEADPAVVERLQADVRQLAQGGDVATLTAFAFAIDAQAYGASRTEREAYKEAWLRIVDEGNPGSAESNRQLIDKLERFSRVAPLTAEQQQEAQALAQQVVDAYRHNQNQGG